MKILYCTLFTLFIAGIAHAQITIKPEEVSQHIGDSVTVCGKVADMRYFESSGNKPTFLNMVPGIPGSSLLF